MIEKEKIEEVEVVIAGSVPDVVTRFCLETNGRINPDSYETRAALRIGDVLLVKDAP